MSGSQPPLLAIPLRDGRQLRVARDGVHVEGQFYDLARIREAWMIRAEPELIGLTLSDVGLVEFEPARQGDGAAVLHAIYSLRPDLRAPASPSRPLVTPTTTPAPLHTPAAPLPPSPPSPPPVVLAEPAAPVTPVAPVEPAAPVTPVATPPPTLPAPAAMLLAIPLRDGRQLRVATDGVSVGDQQYALARIREAWMIRAEPELIGLTLSDVGLVEFEPARQGDGANALRALYSLRPDLRSPASPSRPLATPTAPPPAPTLPPPVAAPVASQPVPHMAPPPPPPGYPPYPPYPPAPPVYPPYLPYAPPPPGYGPPPGYAPVLPFAPNPNQGQGEFTPVPRTFGQILDAMFRLYFKRFGAWMGLSVAAGLILFILLGAIEVIGELLAGQNPLLGSFGLMAPYMMTTTNPAQPFNFNATDLLIISGGLLIYTLLSAVVGAWMTAVLSQGARDVVRGRPIAIGASLRAGLRRFPATLGISILVGLIEFAIFLPFLALYGAGFGLIFSASSVTPSAVPTPTAGLGLILLLVALVVAIPTFILVIWLGTRLGLAVYAAALGMPHAIRLSWNLTRGNFWRTFGAIFIAGLLVGVVVSLGTNVQFASYAVSVLIAVPILEVITLPFTVITGVVLLFDLRLRKEGYPFFAQEMGTPPAPQPGMAAGGPAPVASPPASSAPQQ